MFVSVVYPVAILSAVFCECFEYLYCLACFCCCDFYVSLGSRVCPSIFGLMFMGSVTLSICISSCVLYSAGCEESACCLVWIEDEVVCLSPCMYFM